MSSPAHSPTPRTGRRRFRERIAGLSPFGWGTTKPHHFTDMARIAWRNRDALPYAWRVLTRGVCDGCALGTSGMRDWTVPGVHVCLVRLELLRLNTMGPMDTGRLRDAASLAALSSQALRELGRLPVPLRRRRGEPGFTPVAWDELWADVGARWRGLHPARTAMYVTSRGVTNETYYAAQKVMRWLGSNNVDNSARLCHSPSTSAMKDTLGVAASTCSYTDWYDADVLVFLGSNPANDQPVAMKYLFAARKRGVRVLVVNAYREPGLERYWVPSEAESALFGSKLADRFWLVRVGGDLAFLNAVARVLLARGAQAADFVAQATTGFEAWRAELERQPMDALLAACGLSLAEVEAFADEIARAGKGVLIWSMGITQHAHGGDTVRAIANLGLLREWVGRPGTGLMPIRGHSGVQGGAEMGAYATALPGGVPVDAASAARFAALWGFPVPERPGLTTTEWIEAAGRGALDGLYCIGGNFLETLPQPARVAEALGRIPLRLHSDIVLTSQMLVEPADTVYLLPARTRYEQAGGGTETSTERRVIFSPHVPGHDVGEARAEFEMLAQFARAVKPQGAERLGLDDSAAIRRDIARAVPAYAGIERLARQGDQFQWGGARLCEGRRFPRPDGKARFLAVRPPQLDAAAPPTDAFVLSTRRGKQFNSMVQHDRDPLTGAQRDHVFIAPADAQRLGIRQDDPLRLESPHGSYRGRAFLADVAPGTLQGHWPEVNVLIAPGVVEPGGGVPDYNATVTLAREKVRGGGGA
ncbi:MAG TPA: molybdopterin-dependent oxidoreductase [Planctomycetota bacterium]|nr:molybdopterin-dependent oxidoreductase [Planctomycetota bacterium]